VRVELPLVNPATDRREGRDFAQGRSAVELRPAAPPLTGIPYGAAVGAPATFAATRRRSTTRGPVHAAPQIDSTLL
jgi:hypothetical protein